MVIAGWWNLSIANELNVKVRPILATADELK
jgi:hypothetical protein